MCNQASRENNKSNINLDTKTVSGFGDEWSRFTQEDLDKDARNRIFHDYFGVFPWDSIEANAVGADIGCGSGRWAQVVAPRVGCLHLIDASDKALSVAHRNLKDAPNVVFHHASVDMLPLEDESLDFAYSLGVLHHIPDTAGGIRAISEKLKRGAPFLLYLYYAFDNRSTAYRVLWRITDIARRIISRLPYQARYFVSQLIAILVYFPFARLALLLEKMGVEVSALPLTYYRDKPFYVLRTDALDRFGTRLEQRFTRDEIDMMLREAGFVDIRFSDKEPYWCAVGIKG